MTKTTQNIFLVAGALVFFLGLVALFNFRVDPMCYYHCEGIDLNRKTQNVYYRSAQTAAANPEAEVIVVGSSRGERVSPRWIEKETGLKTVNLSQGGAEVFLKAALVNIALERNPKIKKVIWMADYFELVPTSLDIKTRLTPVLRQYSGLTAAQLKQGVFFEQLQGLIDHRTLEAGLEMIKGSYNEMFNKAGNGDEIDFQACQAPGFVGPTPAEMMDKKISESYATFGGVQADQQSSIYWQTFENEVRSLTARGIDVIINVAPFHPKFMARSWENSLTRKRQEEWANRMMALSGPHVTVLRYDRGIPGDDGGPRYWEDGAHPTCFGVMEMLKSALVK